MMWSARLFVLILGPGALLYGQASGPPRGTLVVSGGAERSGIIVKRFVELAGGPDAPIVVIPTAGTAADYDQYYPGLRRFREAGATKLTILHTRDRNVANSDDFVKPLREARAVWFEGGNQWKSAEAYLDTKVHKELFALLDRGGVIGGGSAGGHIQGDYMNVSREDDVEFAGRKLPKSEWRRGLGFLHNVAIDVHILARNRQFDMIGVIQSHPNMLGIAMDEDTAIVVQGDKCEVIGTSFVLIYDNQRQVGHDKPETFRTVGGLFYFLKPGDTFDLKTREAFRPTRKEVALDRVIRQPWPKD